MGQFDLRGFVDRRKAPDEIRGMEKELQPLQLLRTLHEKHLKRTLEKEIDPIALRRRLGIYRGIAKLLKPLLRFENLFPHQARGMIEIASSQSMTPEVLAAISPGRRAIARYVDNVLDCMDNKERPLVWLEWCISPDLLYAFDVQPFCTEVLVAILNLMGLEYNEMLIDVAEQAGVPVEYCSAARNAIGSYLAGQLPEPDCIVTVSHPCDSMLSSYQALEYLSNAPIFRLDTPYWEDDRGLDYYTEEIRSLIAFLEKHLDRKLDYDRLREVLTEVNKTNELLMEMNEMHRATPCPGTIMTHGMHWAFRLMGMGTPDITEVARNLHKLTRERLEAGQGTIKNEKIRVIWYDVPIAFSPMVIWMEETFGAVVTMDLVCYVNTPTIDTSTPESMIRGLSASYMNLAMARQFHGPLEFFHRDLYRVCEEYNGDCFIYAGHIGCKHGWASVRLLKEHMKKINMPLLVLTSDIFDQRVTNEGQIKAQIEEFFVTNGLV